MNRGAPSPKADAGGHRASDGRGSNDAGLGQGAIPPLPLHESGGGMVVTHEGASRAHENNGGGQQYDLPPYPYPATARAPQRQVIDSTPRTEKALIEEFPRSSLHSAATSAASSASSSIGQSHPEVAGAPQRQVIDSTPRTDKALILEFPKRSTHSSAAAPAPGEAGAGAAQPPPSSFRHRRMIQIEETTFPGFSMYQTAKAHYCLGRYSLALDVTTECLAYQKSFLSGAGDGSVTTAAAAAAAVAASKGSSPKAKPLPSPGTPVQSPGGGDASAGIMTPLDLRSTFVTGVGSSVLGVVQSLNSADGQARGQHHPMLSNSIAVMISQYPSHPCVAQTLLLRGHVLAACGLHGSDDGDDDSDAYSLLVQAIRHVEMAVAIRRKLSIINEDLAGPLIFLGNMKTRTGQFEEAEMAYNEATTILRDVRLHAKFDHAHASKANDDEEVVADCARHLKKVTRGIAHALYLHGKSYHCQRMHAQAFGCYNRALKLLTKSGTPRDKLGVKNVVRCMKNRYALEKLVSAYWDDAGVV